MPPLVRNVHVLVIMTAVMGGVVAVVAAAVKAKGSLSEKRISQLYYVSYGLMALSMFLWALRGLLAPEAE